MRKIDTSRNADITLVSGSAGSGKSAWTKKQIAKETRLAIWDIDDEYSEIRGVKRITKISEFAKALLNADKGKFAFVGNRDDFDMFCRCVFAWSDCTCVTEELSGVTSPGKAPDGWGELVRRGRKYGIKIIAVTQRPSESDKTIVGNASCIHVGRLARAQDRKYMANEMDVPQADLDALKPLEFIEKFATGEVKTGKVTFPGRKSTR